MSSHSQSSQPIINGRRKRLQFNCAQRPRTFISHLASPVRLFFFCPHLAGFDTHLRICTQGWRFFSISAAAYFALVIASSPRALPQPPAGWHPNSMGAQIRHTEPRQRQQKLRRALFGLSRPARDFFFLFYNVILGHVEKAWSS